MSRKWNKGSWSELYVVGSLLASGGAFAGDGMQRALKNSFLHVLRVVLEGPTPDESDEYLYRGELITHTRPFRVRREIRAEQLRAALFGLLEDLRARQHGDFPSESGEKLLELLGRSSPAASSSKKIYDLLLELYYPDQGEYGSLTGFSIKSQVGQPSTLLNASGSTNIIYHLSPQPIDGPSIMEAFNSARSFREAFQVLSTRGIDAVYAGYQPSPRKLHSQFEQNLTLIDSQMPSIVARITKAYYQNSVSSLVQLLDTSFPVGSVGADAIKFKVGEFAGAVAMGLRPNDVWRGDTNRFKGFALLRESGEVLLYDISNIIELREYLVHNLKLETPSLTRHKFGKVYFDNADGVYKLKLNLQLRFIT